MSASCPWPACPVAWPSESTGAQAAPATLQRAGLTEVYRVLKPDGRCLLVDLALHEMDVREAAPLLAAVGFANLAGGAVGFPLVTYLGARQPAAR